MRDRRFLVFATVSLAVILAFAVVVSQFASGDPDGLEYVAGREGFADTARDHALASGPFADYGANLTDSELVNTAIAGAAGVLMTLAIGYGAFALTRRTGRNRTVGDRER